MGVKETAVSIDEYIAACERKGRRFYDQLHGDILCEPLQAVFTKASKEAIQYELINNGLFQPQEWQRVKAVMAKLRKCNIWGAVQREYDKLRKRWHGPDIPIYLYPMTEAVEKKNGIAYQEAIFLFVSDELSEEELGALLAHEYTHICRLHYLNEHPRKLTLQDSLVMEGLAEYAVESIYGERWLCPWTKRYTEEEVTQIWKKDIVPFLSLRDIEKHQPFLFGNGKELPPWIGYCTGYMLVKNYVKRHPCQIRELLNTPTSTIVGEGKI